MIREMCQSAAPGQYVPGGSRPVCKTALTGQEAVCVYFVLARARHLLRPFDDFAHLGDRPPIAQVDPNAGRV